MKRKLSLILALTLIVTLFAGIQVSAAVYTRGTVLDFDTNTVTSFEDGTSLVADDEYGNVFNWNTRAKNLILDFSSSNTVEDLTTDAHILSFDARIAENNILYMYYDDYNPDNSEWKRISYVALRNKNVQASADGGVKWSNVVTGAYEDNEWVHYDMIFYFEDCYADIYIDGEFMAEMSLELNPDNTVNGFNKLIFVGSNSPVDAAMDLSVDNICYKSFTGTSTANIKSGEGQFDVTFSETMGSVKIDDFCVTRIAVGGTDSESVPFTYEAKSFTNGVIIPKIYENGYTYTIVYKGGESALGSSVAPVSVDFVLKQIIIDNLHDFEDDVIGSYGTATTDKVSVIDEEYRGKVFQINGNIDWYYKLDQGLDGGRYIYSFDMKNTGAWGKMRLRFYSNDSWKWFNTFAIESKGMGANFNDTLSAMSDSVVVLDEWHRVDLLLDMDNDKVTAYLDGIKKGSFLLTTASDGTSYDGVFRGSMMSFNNTNGYEYLDNIRVRNIDDKYGTSMNIQDKYIYVDFAETTMGLTEDNFTVTKSDNPLSSEVENVAFTLEYQNGTRAVLKLGENTAAGMTYTVKLNNIESFLGNTPEKKELSYTYTPDVVTTFIDDMTDYTKDALTNATVDTMWTDEHWTTSGNASQSSKDYTTAADGVVTLTSGTDAGKLLRYNIKDIDLNEGIIEIETTVNVTFNSSITGSTQLVFYNFQDSDGTYKIGEFQANGFMPNVSSSATSRVNAAVKDTSYVYGQDNIIKSVIDLSTGIIQTSVNDGEPIVTNYVYGENAETCATDLTDVSILSFTTLKDTGATVKLKNIKITKTVTPSVIGSISFIDVMGNDNGVTEVSSATNKLSVEFPNGLLNDTFNGTIEVSDGTSIVPISAADSGYNAETGIYTFVFDRLWGANKTYQVTLSDIKDKNGKAYNVLQGNITTGDVVKNIVNDDVTKTADGIAVTVKGVNTGEPEVYYVIYTGYNGNKLVAMDYEAWELDESFDEYVKTFSFTDSKVSKCDKISSYIWRSFGAIKPVTNSITK